MLYSFIYTVTAPAKLNREQLSELLQRYYEGADAMGGGFETSNLKVPAKGTDEKYFVKFVRDLTEDQELIPKGVSTDTGLRAQFTRELNAAQEMPGIEPMLFDYVSGPHFGDDYGDYLD